MVNTNTAHNLAVEVQTRSDAKPAAVIVGYHKPGFLIGAMFNIGVDYSEAGLPEAPLAGTSVTWAAGATMRLRIAASSDERVEAFAQADVGAGEKSLSGDNIDPIRITRFTYFAGIGLHYWLHPQFAIGGQVGFRGELLSGDTATHSSRIDSGLHVLAVF